MPRDLPFLPPMLPSPVALSPQAYLLLCVIWLLGLQQSHVKVQFEVIKLVGQDGSGMGSRNFMSLGLPFTRVIKFVVHTEGNHR